MNIESAKLASVLQKGAPPEGGGQSLIDNGSLPGEFAGTLDALKAQMESAADFKVQDKLMKADEISLQPNGEFPQPDTADSNLSGNTRLQNGRTETQPIAGSAEPDTADDVDLKAALEAVTDSLNYRAKGSGEGATLKGDLENSSGKVSGSKGEELGSALTTTTSSADFIETSPQHDKAVAAAPVVVVSNPPLEVNENSEVKRNAGMPIADLVGKPKAKIDENTPSLREDTKKLSKQVPESGAEAESEVPAQALSLVNSLPTMPLPAGGEKSVNDSTDEILSKSRNVPQSFIKPIFEELKSNASGQVKTSEEDSQKSAVFGQIVKESLYLNANRSEKALPSETGELTESRMSISDVDKSLPRGIPEIAHFNRQPVENRMEIPAMTKPLMHPDWNKELGERIVWMNNKELSAAEIKLNPEHLGPISVRIEMNNDQATIAFTAQHAAVRDALEASIPKLREMMNNQQLNLTDVNISQNHSSGQQQQSSFQQSPRNFAGFDLMPEGVTETGEELGNSGAVIGKGILNIYA